MRTIIWNFTHHTNNYLKVAHDTNQVHLDMNRMDIEQDPKSMHEFITREGIATEDEMDLVENINGACKETCLNVLYVRTGYNSIEQYIEDELQQDVDEYLMTF